MNSLLKTVTRQRRGCDLNPGPSAPESSTLTTRLPSHPSVLRITIKLQVVNVLNMIRCARRRRASRTNRRAVPTTS